MTDAELNNMVTTTVRIEVDRVVAPLLTSLTHIGEKLDSIQASIQAGALTRVAMSGRIDRIDERSEMNRSAISTTAAQLANTRETQSGIAAWKAVVGAIILGGVGTLVGAAVMANL
jgi:hypothetical protein